MCKILIHETEAVISLDLKLLLKKHKLTFSSSMRNLFYFLRNQTFDLLVLDISNITGYNHLIKFMRRFNIPVIILSSDPGRNLKNILANKEPVIEFPYDSNDIIAVIKRYYPDPD
jgi:DNA-binding response OmpR family regulator